jgi:hypothetical protein
MNKKLNSIGKPPSSQRIYELLFDFLDNTLLKFKVLSKDNKGNLNTSEDAITEDLADFLDEKQQMLDQDINTSFRFTNQSQRKADIGVKFGRDYNSYNRVPFCWIEAKRLPTPIRKDRDKREYVIVDKSNKKFKGNGGIQRFKEGKHAPDLEYSIMIGYIQDDNNADYWLSRINEWITELANADGVFWSHKDRLKRIDSHKCDRFLSIHKRKEGTPIILHHYWIKLYVQNVKCKVDKTNEST